MPDLRSLQQNCQGILPLTARLEPWMTDALKGHVMESLVVRYGSPLNILNPDPMAENVAELEAVARDRQLDFRVFFARKSNKCLSFVDQAIHCGIGMDTASENEIRQAMLRGTKPDDLICTAAIKDASLVRWCGEHQIALAIDNHDELNRVAAASAPPPLAIRISGFGHSGRKLRSRFGYDVLAVTPLIADLERLGLRVNGIHFHLDGWDRDERISAIRQCLTVLDQFRDHGHDMKYLDIGGGFPISYLDSKGQWTAFWKAHEDALQGNREPVTYGKCDLGRSQAAPAQANDRYACPSFPPATRASWFAGILDHPINGHTLSDEIRNRNLQLRCEPGRGLMAGCGMTVARVEFRKQNAQGDWLIGLAMNRTQCRTTCDDFLVDPLLLSSKVHSSVPAGECRSLHQQADRGPIEGYLVGAYCTECEFLMWRKLRFPRGVRVGDLIVFPNTAGYWMHFLESRSHQFPLAKNVLWNSTHPELSKLDLIDS